MGNKYGYLKAYIATLVEVNKCQRLSLYIINIDY